ncbi:protein S100-Z-like [Centropristis striata]|uniref:protein S100-Z-like n=1 Tax=Centropristis striata TaxID=184440 RepID=UPI0027E0BBE0|nr:protein S100-Z-like [Centropristis striata]
MTELEQSMESLYLVFHKYADGDSDAKTITKKELKKLMNTELPSFMKNQRNPKVVDYILKDLDANKDDKLDFEEFHPLVARLSMISLGSAAVTELEKSMESLMKTFNKHADEDADDTHTLTKKELKKIVEAELPSFLKAQKDPETVDNILKDFDANKDDKLDFGEFLLLVARISISCEKFYMLSCKKKSKK